MSDTLFCVKLQKTATRLCAPPFPGKTGELIYQTVSQEAWAMWLAHQTMLINEYRLSLIEPQARDFLREEMNKFFFSTGSEKPAGFVPIDKNNN